MIRGVFCARQRSMARVIFSPTTAPHAAADEFEFKRADLDFTAIEKAAGANHCVRQARCLFHFAETLPVRFGIDKLQRVRRAKLVIVSDVLAIVEQLLQPVAGADAEVVPALRTDVLIFFDSFTPDDLVAGVTLLPESFGFYSFFAIGEKGRPPQKASAG